LGTASHNNFDSYGLLYASGATPTGSSQWVPIVFGVKTMVVNGPLATWDTTELPNGQYTLALALYEIGNSEPKLFFVNNITVQNEQATPTPEATPTEEAAEPTQEQGPTPVVEQPGTAPIGPTVDLPPTATPRPTPTLSTDETPQPEENTLATTNIFSMEALRETFCSGVQIAVLLYIFGGLYVAAKAAWRYYRRYQRRDQHRCRYEDRVTSEPGNHA